MYFSSPNHSSIIVVHCGVDYRISDNNQLTISAHGYAFKILFSFSRTLSLLKHEQFIQFLQTLQRTSSFAAIDHVVQRDAREEEQGCVHTVHETIIFQTVSEETCKKNVHWEQRRSPGQVHSQ